MESLVLIHQYLHRTMPSWVFAKFTDSKEEKDTIYNILYHQNTVDYILIIPDRSVALM